MYLAHVGLDHDVGHPSGEPDQGIVLQRVVPDGPSDEAGLKEGDIVIRIDGRSVSARRLGARLAQIGAGETVTVSLIRDGERMERALTLGERPRPQP